MRGLFARAGEVEFRSDLEPPRPAPGESRVRVLLAGVCATDLALVRGYMNFEGVPGHEFVGVALDGPFAGKRVVGEINAPCGSCERCLSGPAGRRHCASRSVLGILGRSGAFADELALPAQNLFPVPESLASEAATFTEPLAAAFEIAEQLGRETLDGARALVIGDGRLGLLCAQVLAIEGSKVALLGRHPERAAFLGAGVELLPRGSDANGFDLVVEATGDPRGLAEALARTRPRGTVVLKTTSEKKVELDLAPLVVDEIRLVGSRCGPFEPALEALAAGRVVVEPMIDGRFPLEEGPRALREAALSGRLKILIAIGMD